MQRKINRLWKIKYILPSTFVLMIIMISSLIMWFYFHLYQKHFISNLSYEHVNTLSQISGNIDKIQAETITISDLYLNNDFFRDITYDLSSDLSVDPEMIYETFKQLDSSIRNTLTHCSFDYEIQFLGEKECYYSTDSKKLDTMKLYQDQLWYYDAISSNTDLYWLPSIKIGGALAYDNNFFSLLRFVKNNDGSIIGLFMINIAEDVLYNTYQDLITPNEGNIYLVSNQGQIISHKDKHMIGHYYYKMSTFYDLFEEKSSAIINKSDIPYLFSKYESTDPSWIIVEEIKFSSIQKPFFTITKTILLFVFATCFVCIIIALLISKYITSQISLICNAMNEASTGNLDIAFPNSGFYEIKIISNTCQQFIDQIIGLLNDVKKKEHIKRITELRFYQMQINPHFMHNTLFSIKCMVDMDRKLEACEMLDSLNSMLKNILNTDQKIITVKDEINTLKCYINILSKRYSDSFCVNYHIEEKCEEMLILRFLLQPIVENSIFHGFANQKKDGIIDITIQSNDTHIYLIVEDNGLGISPEILNTLNKDIHPNDRHIGLNNVKARLKLHYNDNAKFLIDTCVGKGCKITIVLPQYSIDHSN